MIQIINIWMVIKQKNDLLKLMDLDTASLSVIICTEIEK